MTLVAAEEKYLAAVREGQQKGVKENI